MPFLRFNAAMPKGAVCSIRSEMISSVTCTVPDEPHTLIQSVGGDWIQVRHSLTDVEAAIRDGTSLVSTPVFSRAGGVCGFCGENVVVASRGEDITDTWKRHILACEKHPAYAMKRELDGLKSVRALGLG